MQLQERDQVVLPYGSSLGVPVSDYGAHLLQCIGTRLIGSLNDEVIVGCHDGVPAKTGYQPMKGRWHQGFEQVIDQALDFVQRTLVLCVFSDLGQRAPFEVSAKKTVR